MKSQLDRAVSSQRFQLPVSLQLLREASIKNHPRKLLNLSPTKSDWPRAKLANLQKYRRAPAKIPFCRNPHESNSLLY